MGRERYYVHVEFREEPCYETSAEVELNDEELEVLRSFSNLTMAQYLNENMDSHDHNEQVTAEGSTGDVDFFFGEKAEDVYGDYRHLDAEDV